MEKANEGSTKMEGDDFGAFIKRFNLFPPPHPSPSTRPLHGLTFSVKDIFDIAGHVTGFGNSDWAKTHAEANSTSSAVVSIIEAGATCVGKTVMDEMAFSINGENKHYGTPINPLAPDRVPGGSSSGSAVAVTVKLVDFSLGTDTGGSVRVPAAYCGIFGFRPSHAAVSTSGVIPMAPTFDTVGWFARDPIILDQVGRVLLKVPLPNISPPSRILIPDDCYKILRSNGIQVSQVLIASAEKIFGGDIVQRINLGSYFSTEIPSLRNFVDESCELMEDTVPSLLALSNAMRTLQRIEFRRCHYEWVNTVKPEIAPEISERVQQALDMTDEHLDHCHLVRSEIQASLGALLEDNGVLAVPVVSGPPPKLCTEVAALESFRAKSFGFLSIAGMSGFCQVVIPLGVRDNLPVSVSLVAKRGGDHFLLNLVQTLYGTLREQASVLGLID